jgi:hypothetical protein
MAGAINVIAFFIGYFLLLSFHVSPCGKWRPPSWTG